MAGDVYVTVVGNLADDPELRFTPNGAAVVKFRMASTPRKLVDGEWKDGKPTWYRVTAWRSLAENVAETLSRGSRAIVYGKLTNETWRKEGEDFDRTSLEIDAEYIGAELTFRSATINQRSGGNSGNSGGQGRSTRAASAPASGTTSGNPNSDPNQGAPNPADAWA